MFPVPGAPVGFEQLSPFSMGMMQIQDPLTGLDGMVELFGQASVWAIDSSGRHHEVDVLGYDLAPAGPGYQVRITGILPPAPNPFVELHVLNDQRAFAYAADPGVCEEELVLIADTFDPGEPGHLYVEGADAGQPVLLMRSSAGPGAGPCNPGFGSPCAGILSPVVTFSRTADARGVVDFNFPVPAGAPAGPIWWQAVALAGPDTRVSKVVESVVTP
jgi:hypothetical protein